MKLEFKEALRGVLTGCGIQVEMVEEATKIVDDVGGKGVEPNEAGTRNSQESEIGSGALVTNELLPRYET